MTDALVVEWGSAGAALEGDRSGDAHVVAAFPGGTLVAVIDGLGHGPEAADAADAAARVLLAFPGEPVSALVERCHEALRRTRGAVLSVASFDARTSAMTWAGVGNVEGILVRADQAAQPARESIMQRGGVVGYQLPTLRPAALRVTYGDTLVLATDGIRSGFVVDLAITSSPRALAQTIFERHARGTDDALVLVARYVGGAA
jgi:phosphoserine phosphatase RsbX